MEKPLSLKDPQEFDISGNRFLERGAVSRSPLDTILKLVIVFLMVLLSFFMGIWFGKQMTHLSMQSKPSGTSSLAHKVPGTRAGEETEGLEVSMGSMEGDGREGDREKGESGAAPNGEVEKKEKQTSFFSKLPEAPSPSKADLKKPDKLVKPEKAPAITSASVSADSPSLGTGAPTPTRPSVTKADLKKVARTSPRSSVSSAPSPSTPSKSLNPLKVQYALQIASYSKQKEAALRVQKLKSKDFETFYLPAEVNGKKWFRVYVGLFQDLSYAKREKPKLMKKLGIKEAIIKQVP